MTDHADSKPRARSGDWVEVRSAAEILATLDADGKLDGLPFMPEMLAWCGKRVRVSMSAHKSCDTISGRSDGLRMRDAVHLEDVHCDGSAHGGCQADCSVFWKLDWLRHREPAESAARSDEKRGETPDRTEELLASCTLRRPDSSEPLRYSCQATELLKATSVLRWWDVRQYFRDLASGNVRLRDMLGVFLLRWIALLMRAGRSHSLLRPLYDRIARGRGSPSYPYLGGSLKGPTPSATLDLKPGDWVRVRSHEEIRQTLAGWVNRGMRFDPEMVRFCGGTYRVRRRVERIVDERDGRLIELTNDCIVLEGVVCRAECSDRRLFCPRAIPSYWREIWLEHVEEPDARAQGPVG